MCVTLTSWRLTLNDSVVEPDPEWLRRGAWLWVTPSWSLTLSDSVVEPDSEWLVTYQTVNILFTHSPLLNLHIGVPQVSILGPLLFLIYNKDIVNCSNILSFVLFADDTTVYVQHDSIDGAIQIINSELAKVAEWFDSDKLTLT